MGQLIPGKILSKYERPTVRATGDKQLPASANFAPPPAEPGADAHDRSVQSKNDARRRHPQTSVEVNACKAECSAASLCRAMRSNARKPDIEGLRLSAQASGAALSSLGDPEKLVAELKLGKPRRAPGVITAEDEARRSQSAGHMPMEEDRHNIQAKPRRPQAAREL